MLNDDIKIDLHIHSSVSDYKDGEIVANSTIENLDTLVSKLEENKIVLCAITDHNRFNYDIYSALRDKIEQGSGIVKHNLPGVEFDVKFEDGKPSCHIVAIFDDNEDEKIEVIQDKINNVKMINDNADFFTNSEFEEVLREIGLNTILIVHQKQGLDNNNERTASLSGSSGNPYQIIEAGYIDALEYNTPRVEGIVKASLRKVGMVRSVPLVTGSDCHTWECYPKHDASSDSSDKYFTELRCLPTFKGLLMAITSFETRANRRKNPNKHFLQKISIGDKEYKLCNGINAIIGDNGSGKSMLLKLMHSSQTESYYMKLIRNNNIKIDDESNNVEDSRKIIVTQGSIIDKVKSGNLFEDKAGQYYKNISTREIFANNIKKYFDGVYSYVDNEIKKNEAIIELDNLFLKIEPHSFDFYYPQIDTNIKLDKIEDEERVNELTNIIEGLRLEVKNYENYYSVNEEIDNINEAIGILDDVKNTLQSKMKFKEQVNKVKSIIINKLNDLDSLFEDKRNSQENEADSISENYSKFKDEVIKCIEKQQITKMFPAFPKKISGVSRNEIDGYVFCREAKYHDEDLEAPFYEYCFNKKYNSKDKLMKIKTKEEFSNALSNYDYDKIEDFKNVKLKGFIKDYQEEVSSISEAESGNAVGNTPGEIALVYYKFITRKRTEDYDILLIDQPEDDINPQRIKEFLNNFINSIRDSKQIIIVTHNPLLVVNLDVDNVIYIEKRNNEISIETGCLEYECDEYSVLNLVKDNLDGGYDAIERRIKAYGKN